MEMFGKVLGVAPLVIAEAGVNHEGSLEAALRLVALAAEAGADAIKFQSYTPERFIAATDAERLARVRRFGLDAAAHRRLAAEAERRGIGFFSTPVSEDWVPLLAEICPVLKIASGDIDFAPVLRAVAQSGRPAILSTGCADMDEVAAAVRLFEDALDGAPLAERLALMHCVSAYPTPVEQANLRAIPALKRRFGLPVGWSNHVIGTQACLAAVALGAEIVEVHVTESRADRVFRDHALSLEPAELAELVIAARAVHAALGDGEKRPQPCEAPARAALRKGLAAARDLAVGTVLADGDLVFARPATEFASGEIGAVLGRRLKVSVAAGQPLPRDAVE